MSTVKKLDQFSSLDTEAHLIALNKNYAVIEFTPDGRIINANSTFLSAMGYELSEIMDQHHRIFCPKDVYESPNYAQFWQDLAAGESKIDEFKRITAEGKIIWLSASYTPIKNKHGKVEKIVKFAQNQTKSILRNAEYKGKMAAINKSQAVIEFQPDGTIIKANDNFLQGLGYELDEIQNKHHRMFCEEDYANSFEYKNFWKQLAAGEFSSGEYKRIKKNGDPIWINASYNPIIDNDGNVFKVVKFASDVTAEKIKNSDYESQIKAIDKSQAVIEFTPDGTILTANQNFLGATGYQLNEIVGKHHRIFCEKKYAQSSEYTKFWNKLGRGEFDAGEYKRVGKEGNDIWINASYNPLFDLDGNVYKVVKYATDLTKEKETYNNLVNTFEQAANNLLGRAEELSASATQLSQNAQNTLEESNTAFAAVEEVHVGIQTVGSSTEEMEASIKEISVSSSDASSMSKQAKQKSKDANHTINLLGVASEEIGNVLKVISSIAQQTNLLALNATIEAARAGEAGRGFSVVANEVKELAKQTAQATEDITSKINNVQSSTGDAISAISEVSEFIDKLNEIAASTAAAVEEQSATTSEVSRVILESNTSIASVTDTIKHVAESAEENSFASKRTLESAENLRSLSENLKVLVNEAKKD